MAPSLRRCLPSPLGVSQHARARRERALTSIEARAFTMQSRRRSRCGRRHAHREAARATASTFPVLLRSSDPTRRPSTSPDESARARPEASFRSDEGIWPSTAAPSSTTVTRRETLAPGNPRAVGHRALNPDVLHAGILPHPHVLGAHVPEPQVRRSTSCTRTRASSARTWPTCCAGFAPAWPVSRLRPVLIGATATIGNPGEHAGACSPSSIRAPHRDHRESGAEGERRVFLYNPPVVNEELGIRLRALRSRRSCSRRTSLREGADDRVRTIAQQRPR